MRRTEKLIRLRLEKIGIKSKSTSKEGNESIFDVSVKNSSRNILVSSTKIIHKENIYNNEVNEKLALYIEDM